MPHFKVDDAIHSHPKAAMAGDAAMGLWLRAGGFCCGYGTDGFVPDWWIKQQPQGRTKASRLVAVQLWHRGHYEGGRPEYQGQSGYNFHEWRQDSYEKVEADRKKWRNKKAGQRAPSSPASPGDTTGDTPGDSRKSPGYIPNTLYPEDFGYVPESATESTARDPGRGAAAATPAADLVRRAIPAEINDAIKTELRFRAGALLKSGTSKDVVEEALRDWAAKTGIGPGILPSLAADVVKRRNGHTAHATPTGKPHKLRTLAELTQSERAKEAAALTTSAQKELT